MNQFRMIAAVAITGLVGVLPAAAQGKSGTHGAGATTHGRPTTTTATGTATTTSPTSHGKSADAGSRGNAKSDRQSSTTTSSSTANTTTTTTVGPNALSTKISSNSEQLAKVSGMLPQGVTLEQATAGFRNQGQFIAALNASKNQGVSFADLQTAMTVDGLSLGQAVKQLRNAPPAPDAPEAPATGGTTTPTTTTSTTTPSTQKSS
jgi:hypothetical protein